MPRGFCAIHNRDVLLRSRQTLIPETGRLGGLQSTDWAGFLRVPFLLGLKGGRKTKPQFVGLPHFDTYSNWLLQEALLSARHDLSPWDSRLVKSVVGQREGEDGLALSATSVQLEPWASATDDPSSHQRICRLEESELEDTWKTNVLL